MKLSPRWQHRLTRLVEGLIGVTVIAAAVILWRWFRDGGGLEAVYVAIGVLLAALFTFRRWLQAAGAPAASQHAGWGASTQSHNEMRALRQQMEQTFSLDDLRALTFDLNLNYENLAGETLERKIISLLESCRRQNLLPLLLTHLQAQRPHIAWAQVSALPVATTLQAQRNRENLLNNVQTAWIDGFLKQSLHSEVIKLSLSYRPEAVGQRPWQLILKQTGQPDAPVSPDETLLDIFTAAGRNLLILGEPGSGKTITLLQLAEALIALARQNPAEPLPIILNLSSWAREQPPLSDWLVEEMFVQYGVARDLTRAGIAQNQFLYLLDGLDEVAAEARDACVTALNEFKAIFPAELVVCSRTAEYAALQEQLHLGAAIQIKPLTDAQIESYLAREGAELAAVRTTLAHDAELRELAQSPLMLSLMTLAYRGETAIDLRPDAGKETRRQHLFAHYVQKMFDRPRPIAEKPYSQAQAMTWLSNLAYGMRQQDLSIFYMERLNVNWLHSKKLRRNFDRTTLVSFTSIVGLILGISSKNILVFFLSLLFFTGYGLLLSWFQFSVLKQDTTRNPSELVEKVSFHLPSGRHMWKQVQQSLLVGMGISLPASIGLGMLFIAGMDEDYSTLGLIVVGSFIGLAISIALGLINSIIGFAAGLRAKRQILQDRAAFSKKQKRNLFFQVIKQNWYVSAFLGSYSGSIAGLIFALTNNSINAVFFGATVGLTIGLLFALFAQVDFWGIEWNNESVLKRKLAEDFGKKRVLLFFTILGVGCGFLGGFIFVAIDIPTPIPGVLPALLIFLLMAGLLLFVACLSFLVSPLEGFIETQELTERLYPNEGIKSTGWNAVRMAIVGGIIGSGIASIADYFVSEPIVNFWLGLVGGSFIFGFFFGAGAVVEHYTVRFVLSRSNILPHPFSDKKLTAFLDVMHDLILLRKVGAGWIFVHRSLLEHFAGLINQHVEEENNQIIVESENGKS